MEILVLFGPPIAFIAWLVYLYKNDNSSYKDAGLYAVGGGIIVALWLLIVGLIVVGTYSKSNRLEAFYYDNLSAYEHTVDDAGRVVIEVTDNREGVVTDFTNRVESDRLAELRDAVVQYNADLRNIREFDKLPVAGWLVAGPAGDLQPITLRER